MEATPTVETLGADIKPTRELREVLAPFGLSETEIATLREARKNFERSYIVAVLQQHGWRMGAAARALGLQRPNLYRKARQLRIPLRASNP